LALKAQKAALEQNRHKNISDVKQPNRISCLMRMLTDARFRVGHLDSKESCSNMR